MAGEAADKTTAMIIPLLLTLVTSSTLDFTPQTIWDNASLSTAQQQVRRWQAAHEHRHLLSNAPAAAHSASPKASQHSTKSTTNQQPTSTPLCRHTLGSLHSEQPVEQGTQAEGSHQFSTATQQKQHLDAKPLFIQSRLMRTPRCNYSIGDDPAYVR